MSINLLKTRLLEVRAWWESKPSTQVLTLLPLGPGRPMLPGCPRIPMEPGGPGRPSSPGAPCKVDRSKVSFCKFSLNSHHLSFRTYKSYMSFKLSFTLYLVNQNSWVFKKTCWSVLSFENRDFTLSVHKPQLRVSLRSHSHRENFRSSLIYSSLR